MSQNLAQNAALGGVLGFYGGITVPGGNVQMKPPMIPAMHSYIVRRWFVSTVPVQLSRGGHTSKNHSSHGTTEPPSVGLG